MNTLGWPCCCCHSKICISATKFCDHLGDPLSGVVVVLKNPDGSTFGTQTTDGTGKVCFDIGTATGTFTWSATWVNGDVKTGSVNVTSCQEYDRGATFIDKSCVTVTGCDGTPISDATVTICGHSATYSGGQYCFSWASAVPPTSPCTVTVTLATGPSKSQSFLPGCGISFSFIDRICVAVGGCNGPLAGASVTIKNGGTSLSSGTTGGDGKFCFQPSTDLTGVTLTITASKPPRYADNTINVTAACDLGINLSPATGYFCCLNCPDPLKKVLQVTDANGVHATKNGSQATGFGGLCTWNVCYQTPAVANAYKNDFTGCGPQVAATWIEYQLQYDGSSWRVVASWPEQSCTGVDVYYATVGSGCSTAGQVIPGFGVAVDSAAGTLTGDCSVPTVLTGTVPSPGANLPSPVTGGITVTE